MTNTQNDEPDLPFAAAASRNAEPIELVLTPLLKPGLRVLELASGTGQHIARFAALEPSSSWQPTDPDAAQCATIDERVRRANLTNVEPAMEMAAEEPWPDGAWDLVIAINLVHIAPWSTTQALLAASAEALSEGGRLFLYGPYREGGQHVSEGNVAFDRSLRESDPKIGIRELEKLVEEGDKRGLKLAKRIEMPANNRALLFALAREPF